MRIKAEEKNNYNKHEGIVSSKAYEAMRVGMEHTRRGHEIGRHREKTRIIKASEDEEEDVDEGCVE